MLIVGIAGFGFFVGGSQQALKQVESAIRAYVPRNADILDSVNDILKHILADRALIGVIGLLGLLYGAHQAFLALQPAMNIILGRPGKSALAAAEAYRVRGRFLHHRSHGHEPRSDRFLRLSLLATVFPYLPSRIEANILSGFLGMVPMIDSRPAVCALLYRLLPSCKVPWKAAFLGAGVAAPVLAIDAGRIWSLPVPFPQLRPSPMGRSEGW